MNTKLKLIVKIICKIILDSFSITVLVPLLNKITTLTLENR